ncbi:XrtA system polysaccharide chain length determinant [Siccirubricoccus phaeus]|uniref:XrtA system polysaccharide chain length determinant n=1 Tax=Siccirubricoccus phaeus TaxID=2595053 RepID=UPI0011F2ACA6|nr:XrtA system polysaccharide chain length determinant [Siccirubricoccus phaeus]
MQLLTQARRFAKSGWRHRWKAMLLAWAICALGWAAVSNLPDQYRATARLYADADMILGQLLRGIAVDNAPANQVDILQRTLLSQPNLERVIARTDLDLRVNSVAAREALLQRLARDVRITTQTRNLFTISYTDRDPRLARDVVQTLLTIFIESASSNDRQAMENARAFVAQQIASYETQLREAERRRAEFRARYIDLLPQDSLGGVSRMEAARASLLRLRGELQDLVVRRDLMKPQLQSLPQTLTAAEAAGGPPAESRIAEGERLLRELRLRFTEQHPDVIAARTALAELRASGTGGAPSRGGGGTQTTRPNPVYEQMKLRLIEMDAEIASRERRVQEEEQQVERLEAIARGAPQLQAQYQNLDRDYNVLRRNYEELLARREAVQIAGAARSGTDRVRLEIVDPPMVPSLPTGPNRFLLASAVLALGLGAGAGLALLLVQFDRGFYTLHDLRQLGLPVLGSVSSTLAPASPTVARLSFAGSLGLLLLTYGAVLSVGPKVMARLPSLVARILA